jgi:peptidoglycan-associated lipoprotein
MNTAKISSLLVAVAALLGACSSTPIAPPPVDTAKPVVAAPAQNQAPAKTAPAKPTGAVTTPPVTAALPAYLDPKSPISQERSVYFAFDDDTLDAQYLALINRHGQYLAANPKVTIKVEGNADERGGPEYNLALGQRRAEAVVKALKLVGVKPEQMEAVSWGKEKPKATGHDEAAWSQNRRADLQYPAK